MEKYRYLDKNFQQTGHEMAKINFDGEVEMSPSGNVVTPAEGSATIFVRSGKLWQKKDDGEEGTIGSGNVNMIVWSVVVADWQQAEPEDPYTIDISIADTGIGDTFVASFISNAGEYLSDISYSIAESIITLSANTPRDGKISIFG
jgi:hypothetical protein